MSNKVYIGKNGSIANQEFRGRAAKTARKLDANIAHYERFKDKYYSSTQGSGLGAMKHR